MTSHFNADDVWVVGLDANGSWNWTSTMGSDADDDGAGIAAEDGDATWLVGHHGDDLGDTSTLLLVGAAARACVATMDADGDCVALAEFNASGSLVVTDAGWESNEFVVAVTCNGTLSTPDGPTAVGGTDVAVVALDVPGSVSREATAGEQGGRVERTAELGGRDRPRWDPHREYDVRQRERHARQRRRCLRGLARLRTQLVGCDGARGRG